jgi:hypothetical protein
MSMGVGVSRVCGEEEEGYEDPADEYISASRLPVDM